MTVTENCQAVRRQPQLHWRPVLWQKKIGQPRTATRVVEFGEWRSRQIAGEPRQQSVAVFGDRDKFKNEERPVSATATKMCRRLLRPRQILKWGAAGIGDRDKKVLPTSATATDFKVKGGRYWRPRQKSVFDFGKCDKKVRALSPKSARAVGGMVRVTTKKSKLASAGRLQGLISVV